jgi:ribonuclease P protein subunit RPR2
MNERSREKTRALAEEQIRELFRQAESASPALANRYVKIAWGISTKTKTPIPRELKQRFCRKCLSYLAPGRNCRIRVSRRRVACYCFNCKKFRRFVYK